MKIKVKLFAFLQDQLGPVVTVEVANPVQVAELFNQIGQQAPQLVSTLANSRLAVNQEFVDADELTLTGDEELAIIPPVSGG